MDDFSIDRTACRGRQRRLVEVMREKEIDVVIVTQPEHVQWLTGARPGPMFQPVASLSDQGTMTVVLPDRRLPSDIAADHLLGYEGQSHSTLRNDQRLASSKVLLESLQGQPRPRRLGVEFSTFGPHLAESLGNPSDGAELIDVEPDLYRLRRKKDEDELRLMRKAILATRAMYERAREVVRPGINELDLYSQLYAAAVTEFGEPPTYFGQDFQCNSRGGPPRDRSAESGELYILDLGAGFRGYFSDNARTIAVDGKPTEAQQEAWSAIRRVFAMVESTVKPGVSCRELFLSVQSLLDECLPWQFNHHLGHGVGLYPHEAPHLNPHWDETFNVGEVFTVEPGLYHEELMHGIRLEQNYLVTDDGVELLTDFPLELALTTQ